MRQQSMDIDDAAENSNIKSTADMNAAKRKAGLKMKRKLEKIIDHYIVVILMTIVTVYALYFDDIRILAFPKSADDIFYGITLLGMILFIVEIMIASYAKDGYKNSFFFWLDIVSTVTMIPDCGWIWDPIIGGGDSEGGDSAASLAKTSRAGRVTRVIRVIRLIRLIRIVKLYKQSQLAKQKANEYRSKAQSKISHNQKVQLQQQKIHPMEGMVKD